MLFTIILPSIFISCEDKYTTEEARDCSTITKEASVFKNKFIEQMPVIKSLVENSLQKIAASEQLCSNSDLSALLSEMSVHSLATLESYGFEYADIKMYVDSIDDPRIAVIGMVFLALQEKSPNEKGVRLKSSSENGEQEFSYGQVMDCLGRAFLGVNVADYIYGSATKFTLATSLGIAGRIASRTLGVLGAAIAVADFGDCMGWYNLW